MSSILKKEYSIDFLLKKNDNNLKSYSKYIDFFN